MEMFGIDCGGGHVDGYIVKTHQTVYLKWMHCIMCKLCLEVNLKRKINLAYSESTKTAGKVMGHSILKRRSAHGL